MGIKTILRVRAIRAIRVCLRHRLRRIMDSQDSLPPSSNSFTPATTMRRHTHSPRLSCTHSILTSKRTVVVDFPRRATITSAAGPRRPSPPHLRNRHNRHPPRTAIHVRTATSPSHATLTANDTWRSICQAVQGTTAAVTVTKTTVGPIR